LKRAGLLTKVRDEYQRTFAYKQVEWTLAALYRIGNLYETFSDTLFAAPPPPEVKKLGDDYVEEYRALLEEQAVPLEDKAVDAYKRTIAEAKKSGMADEWTKRTLRSLNKLRKKEFPLQKDAKYDVSLTTFGIPALADQPPMAPSVGDAKGASKAPPAKAVIAPGAASQPSASSQPAASSLPTASSQPASRPVPAGPVSVNHEATPR
jgi:hypothetical protein